MAHSTMLHVRVDDEIKTQASEALAAMGLSVSDAVRILLKNAIKENDLLMQKMGQGVQTLENRMFLNENLWRTQINRALQEYQLRGLAALLDASEEVNNKLIEVNNKNVAETVKRISEAAGKPGVDLALLRQTVQLTDQLIKEDRERSIENRKRLQEASRMADEIDESMNTKHDSLEVLRRHLAMQEQDIDDDDSNI